MMFTCLLLIFAFQYPGVANDIGIQAYSLTWAYNSKWTSAFPGGQEIQERFIFETRNYISI